MQNSIFTLHISKRLGQSLLAVGVCLGLLAGGEALGLFDRTGETRELKTAGTFDRVLTTSDGEKYEIAMPMDMERPPAPPRLKSSLPADPFRQLAKAGLDGHELLFAARDLGVDVSSLTGLDLAMIDLDGMDQQERRCLSQAIYYEARDQSVTGQMAVADVVMNRVSHSRYPNSVCGVVYQGSARETGCQFTFTCDGSLKKPVEHRAMVKAQVLATAVLGGFQVPLSANATNYHATYVDPYWAPTLDETAKIGDHVFYKRGVKFDRYLRDRSRHQISTTG